MGARTWSEAELQVENHRLAEQVRAFSGDEHLNREAALWRDATPEERIAETWRLCSLLPWFRSLWAPELQARVEVHEQLPADVLALLERMREETGGR